MMHIIDTIYYQQLVLCPWMFLTGDTLFFNLLLLGYTLYWLVQITSSVCVDGVVLVYSANRNLVK